MKAAKKKKVTRSMVCDCGGHLHPAKLEAFDFSKYVGFKVTLTGMDGLKCDKCGWETIDGGRINAALKHMVVDFARFPRRLNGVEAAYLRRSIGATQEELANRMGIVRETVAKWECGAQEISPQHDLILRTLAITSFVSRGFIHPDHLPAILGHFMAVRADPPQKETTSINMEGMDTSVGRSSRERRAATG